MFRYYTPRHRLTLRVLIGVGCVVVLLATGYATDDDDSPTGAVRPVGTVGSVAPVIDGGPVLGPLPGPAR